MIATRNAMSSLVSTTLTNEWQLGIVSTFPVFSLPSYFLSLTDRTVDITALVEIVLVQTIRERIDEFSDCVEFVHYMTIIKANLNHLLFPCVVDLCERIIL
jgi:hypothetical protein